MMQVHLDSGTSMVFLLEILGRAALDLPRPRIVSMLIAPMLLALVLWGGLYWVYGASWLAALGGLLEDSPLTHWLGSTIAGWVHGLGAGALLLLLLLPAVYLTAILLTSLLFMPILLAVVAGNHYPDLDRRHGGSNLGSLMNSLRALAIYVVLWLVSLPFWLLGPLGAGGALLLNAWLNQRLFLYDALAEHASREELARLRARADWRLYALAGFLGLLHLVPIINFFAPIYMGLAFTHYALGQLARLRQEAPT